MARNSPNSRKPNRKSTNSGSFVGVMDMARERPVTAAAAAAGAVAASVFLWTKRNQISDQLSQLSDQIGEWTENKNSGNASAELKTVGNTKIIGTGTGSPTRRKRKTTGSGRRSTSSSRAIGAGNSGSPVA